MAIVWILYYVISGIGFFLFGMAAGEAKVIHRNIENKDPERSDSDVR